jgi:hypothetical protein
MDGFALLESEATGILRDNDLVLLQVRLARAPALLLRSLHLGLPVGRAGAPAGCRAHCCARAF